MKLLALARRALAASLLVPVFPSLALENAALVHPTDVGDTGVVTTSPAVPVPAGEPCVVTLFDQAFVDEQDPGPPEWMPHPDVGTPYTYTPPAGCRGPWAKVVLKVSVIDYGGGDPAKAYVRLHGIELFEGALSDLHTPPLQPTWQVERDVTDLSSVLTEPHSGQVGLFPEQTFWQQNRTNAQAVVSAQLFFYPASSVPPPKTPDAVFRVLPTANTVTLPHNIVRAYLDVYNDEPWWYTCVSDQVSSTGLPLFSSLAPGAFEKASIFTPPEGCRGDAFTDIQVSIDGTPAGVAPVFPLLPTNLNIYFRNTFNAPIQPPQRLNYAPYRVDLTPFAAILNEAGEHTIALSGWRRAYLLVYQDKQSTHVSGAVTLNTLQGSANAPSVDGAFQTSGDTASGQITTTLDRDFKIQGFVNTSRGRVDSTVHQTSHFQNKQVFYLDGLVYPDYRHYQQHLWLDSQTQQRSRRVRGGTVLQDNTLTASYPLVLLYDMDGEVVYTDALEAYPSKGTASVEQHRKLDGTYFKAGFGSYTSSVREGFKASNTYDIDTNQHSDWQTQAQYRFNDNRGSCYQSALTAIDGAVATEASGVGCTDGTNFLRWYSHPDGSPESLGWAH